MNRRELLQSLGAVGLTVINRNADEDMSEKPVLVEAGPPILAVLSYPRRLDHDTHVALKQGLGDVLKQAGLDIPVLLLTDGMTIEFVRRNQVMETQPTREPS